MAITTDCQTPDVLYNTHIKGEEGVIEIDLNLPFRFRVTDAEAELLETNIHNALELVLSATFKSFGADIRPSPSL